MPPTRTRFEIPPLAGARDAWRWDEQAHGGNRSLRWDRVALEVTSGCDGGVDEAGGEKVKGYGVGWAVFELAEIASETHTARTEVMPAVAVEFEGPPSQKTDRKQRGVSGAWRRP